MHGHEPIIAMRRNGRKPAIVFINDYESSESKDWQNPGERYGETWPMDHATVCTAGDTIQLLDMRFLVGLTVSITAFDESRARLLMAKARQGGASSIGCGAGKWSEIWHREQSNG